MTSQVKCKNCYHYKNEWCKIVIDSPDPDMLRTCPNFRQKTNGDMVRRLSDDELADVMAEADCIGEACPCDNCNDIGCHDAWIAWLKQAMSDG